MKAGLVLMLGLGFCLGFLFSLLLQLPRVSSPVHHREIKNIHWESRRTLQNVYGGRNLDNGQFKQPVPLRFVQGNSNRYLLAERKTSDRDTFVRHGESDSGLIEDLSKYPHSDNKLAKHISLPRVKGEPQKGTQIVATQVAEDTQSRTIISSEHGQQTPLRPSKIQGSRVSDGQRDIKRHLRSGPANVPTTSKLNRVSQLVSQDKTIINTRQTVNSVKNTLDVSIRNTTGKMEVSLHSLNSSVLFDGIYFTQNIETLVPGFTGKNMSKWQHKARTQKVVGLQEGCGRMQNRLLTLDDGTKACARYRINTDQMQGEVYTFYLALLLGIRNVLPLAVLSPDPRDSQWSGVPKALTAAQWGSDRPVIVTPWVEDLGEAYIPRELRSSEGRLSPTQDTISDRTSADLTELAQWSDLIVLDYITGHVDRVVNNMFNEQWNQDIMNSPTHNLAKSQKTGMLVFLDNESGLFHSYRLLDKYHHYHESLLKRLCIFRKSTVKALRKLHSGNNVSNVLQDIFRNSEPNSHLIPKIPSRYSKILSERLAHVLNQVEICERKYAT